MTDTAVASSYITTIEDFESRIGSDPRTAAIALKAADSTTQTWYLQRATQDLDSLPFIGYKYDYAQELEHPRKYVNDPEAIDPWGRSPNIDSYGYIYDSAVPEIIKKATVEEAIKLYELYTSTSPISESSLQAAGVQSFSLGKLSMSFAPGSASRYGSLKSKEAYDMIMQAGYIEMAPLII